LREWALTQFAAARIGLILTTIIGLPASELAFTVEQVGMIGGGRGGALQDQRLRRHARSGSTALRSSTGSFSARPGAAGPRLDDLRRARRRAIAIGFAKSAPPLMAATRSTSSSPAAPRLPKGATLSHRNILNNGWFVGARSARRRDRLCIPVPLYHCFGMVMGNLAA
jgi:fatty-acyl-CoA synthase